MSKKTIWVTRWALTKGIKRHNAEISNNGEMATYKVDGYAVYVHGKDFYLTEDEAKTDANARVVRKIASTEKQLTKLKSLVF